MSEQSLEVSMVGELLAELGASMRALAAEGAG